MDNENVVHAHIGAGKLGLGLIIPLAKEAGLTVFLLNRDKDKSKNEKLSEKKYKILPSNTTVTFDRFAVFDENNVSDDLINELSEGNVRILTVSVGEANIEKVASYISRIVQKKREKNSRQSLIVIACENIRNNSHHLKRKVMNLISKSDRDYLNSHVYFCSCVVDRICSDLKTERVLVEVYAHNPYSWKISLDGLPSNEKNFLKNSFGRNGGKVSFLNKNDLDVEETLKLWCFNGMHLIIAAYAKNYARDNGEQDFVVSEFLRDQDIILMIHRMQYVFTLAVKSRHNVSYNRVKKYHKEVLEKIRLGPKDMASRVIHDLVGLSEVEFKTETQMKDSMKHLSVFLEKIRARIITPVTIAVRLQRTDGKLLVPSYHLQTCSVMYSMLLNVIREEIKNSV